MDTVRELPTTYCGTDSSAPSSIPARLLRHSWVSLRIEMYTEPRAMSAALFFSVVHLYFPPKQSCLIAQFTVMSFFLEGDTYSRFFFCKHQLDVDPFYDTFSSIWLLLKRSEVRLYKTMPFNICLWGKIPQETGNKVDASRAMKQDLKLSFS